jgi:hypothetical protein
MIMPYKIEKRGNKYVVVKKEGGKVMGTHDSEEKAKSQLKALYANVKENLVWEMQEFKIEEKSPDTESTKWLKVVGNALKVGTSKNNVNYRYQNLAEVANSGFNFIVSHRSDYDNPDHNVGEGVYILEGDLLKMSGKIRNTPQHPDIVEKINDGLVAPSIHGGVKNMIKKGSEVIVEGLHIPLVALVNKHARGVEAASIEVAIEESAAFEMEAEEEEVIKKETNKGEKMSEEVEQFKKQLAEKELELKNLQESIEKQKKGILVESILQINKELKKEELMEKSEIELNIIKGYEQKLKERKESKSEVAEAAPKEDKLSGIVVEKGEITMSKQLYEKFNQDLMQSIYR